MTDRDKGSMTRIHGPDGRGWKQRARFIRAALRGDGPFWLASMFREGRRITAAMLLFEPRDLWVGCYWTVCASAPDEMSVYLCAVPTIVLRVDIRRQAPRPAPEGR